MFFLAFLLSLHWQVPPILLDKQFSDFTPDITPIILAAHTNNYEIIKLLVQKGVSMPQPHEVRDLSVLVVKSAVWVHDNKWLYFTYEPKMLNPMLNLELLSISVGAAPLFRTVCLVLQVRCNCVECVSSSDVDSLRHSRSRLNIYKALSSPSLIALSSEDPFLTAFRLSWELQELSKVRRNDPVKEDFSAQKSLKCEAQPDFDKQASICVW